MLRRSRVRSSRSVVPDYPAASLQRERCCLRAEQACRDPLAAERSLWRSEMGQPLRLSEQALAGVDPGHTRTRAQRFDGNHPEIHSGLITHFVIGGSPLSLPTR